MSAPAASPTGSSPAFIVARFVKPVLFSIFGLKFYSYGIFVAAACLLAFFLFGSELLRARIKLDELNCFFIFLAGFGGGSKAHVVLSALAGGKPLSSDTFIEFIDIRTGHSFLGSMIGCVAALLMYVKWNKVRILPFLDVLLPCCLLGHAIGKVGCFMSGDGCYGPQADPQTVPWAMSFPYGQIPIEVPVHPTPLYEMTTSFLVMVIVRALFPLPNAPIEEGKDDEEVVGTFPREGRRTALLLVLHGIERVIIEQFRRHPPLESFGGLTEYQVVAVVLLIIGAVIELCGRMCEGKQAASAEKATKNTDSKSKKKKAQ